MPGWTAVFAARQPRVIALDNRGHGSRPKLYDPAAYHTDIMAGRRACPDRHLGLGRADVMLFARSRISACCARHPDCVRSVIWAAPGIRLIDNAGCATRSRTRWEAPSLDDVTDPLGRALPRLRGADPLGLKALAAACALAPSRCGWKTSIDPRAGRGRGRYQGRHYRLAA